MARTVKPEAVAAKRREILDAAQRLVLTRGYEQVSIQDILDEVRISSGAFHHYFDSRGALLEAFIERMKQEMEKPLLPILHDPHLSAIEKLQGFFDLVERARSANRADVISLLRVWYSDDNAIMRLKVDESLREQRTPLFTEIIRQGIREGIFSTSYPEYAGEVIVYLLMGMNNTHARLLLSLEQGDDDLRIVEEIVTTYAVYMDAIERVLGAPPHSFSRIDIDAVNVWASALRASDRM
jgi:AcrR family transcriptional regulator